MRFNISLEDLLRKKIATFLEVPEDPKSFRFSAGLCIGSTIGRTRRENQDRALVVKASYRLNSSRENLLAVVCDGMGGLVGGGAAASIAVAEFATAFLRSSRLDTSERLQRAAWKANTAVYSKFEGRGGTTISAICSDSRNIYALNIGDSRVYGFSRGRKLEQLSTDDVLGNLIRRDEVDNEQANHLVQYVGMGEGLYPHIIPIKRGAFELLVLTTDGVHGNFNGLGSKIFNSAADVRQLVRDCVNLSEIAGGYDNGTIVAIDLSELPVPDFEFPGLSLEFLSPYGEFDIWAPMLTEQAGLTQEVRDRIKPAEDTKHVDKQNKSKPSVKKKPGKPRRAKEESLSLPLDKEDDIDVSFPDKSE
jgi:serine/threonine protein phosphatase PrpC